MSINTEEFYSVLASKMEASAIREILKLVQKPEVISLAGGMPDPKTFPVEDIKKITQKVLSSKMEASAIREMLKLVQKPEVISLAGGMPDPKTFPVEDIKKITQKVLSKKSAQALQYSSTEGLPELRKCILEYLAKDGNNGELENIIISSGSQQGLDLVGKTFLSPGDVAIVELPSYLAALNAFYSYGGELVGIPMDEDGMRMDILE